MYSIDQIKKFIYTHNPPGIIVDTNILIVFLVGCYDQDYIENCKVVNDSCKKYTAEDYLLLVKIIGLFKKVYITPQVMAEVSNLSITKGIHGDRQIKYLLKVIEFLKKSQESHTDHKYLFDMEVEVIGKFGLVDVNLVELSKQTKMPILTDDLKLYNTMFDHVPMIKYEYVKYQHLQKLLH